MTKLVYIVDWLPPDHGAIGQYALKESRERAAAGDDVVLVGLSSRTSSTTTETLGRGRLTILRVGRAAVDKTRFARRALWTLDTDALLVSAALPHLVRADEILFTGSPPFLEHLLAPLNAILRKRLVFRIADFHPECAMAELERVPGPLRALQRLAITWRRSVTTLEVLGEDQRRLALSQGVRAERIVLRRSESPVVITPETQPLSIPDELRDYHVLLYSGTVAHAHEIDTFVRGYELHHQRPGRRMGLWLNAEGARADAFEMAVRARGLPIHRSRPLRLSMLARLLVTPDAHLITLRDEYVGLVVPSKVYGCIESGRDVLFIGSAEADVHLLCSAALDRAAYRHVVVGDMQGVAGALDGIAMRASSAPPLRVESTAETSTA